MLPCVRKCLLGTTLPAILCGLLALPPETRAQEEAPATATVTVSAKNESVVKERDKTASVGFVKKIE